MLFDDKRLRHAVQAFNKYGQKHFLVSLGRYPEIEKQPPFLEDWSQD